MNFNDLVYGVLKLRDSLQSPQCRFSFEADVDINICRLHLHPHNGLYAEKAIETSTYRIDENGEAFVSVTTHL